MSLLPPPPTLNCQFDKAETPEDMASLFKSLGITFDRGAEATSIATYINKLGQLKPVPANLARPYYDQNTGDSLGLPVEKGRTNEIRNNTMQGAAVGVIGSGGAMPTNWIEQNKTNITTEVVSIGSEKGYDYIDIKFTASAASSSYRLNFEGYNVITVSQNDIITLSAFFKIIDNTNPVNGVYLNVAERDSGQSQGTVHSGSNFISKLNEFDINRESETFTISDSDAFYSSPYLSIDFSSGDDITLRVYLPQLEEGASATSPIRTSGSAVTRNAEVCYMDGDAFDGIYNQNEGVLFIEGVTNFKLSSFRTFSISDGTNDNRIAGTGFDNGNLGIFINNAGITQVNDSISVASPFKLAYKLADDGVKVFSNGVLSVSDSSCTLPKSLTKLGIGVSPTDALQPNSYFKRLLYWPTASLTDEQLINITRVV